VYNFLLKRPLSLMVLQVMMMVVSYTLEEMEKRGVILQEYSKEVLRYLMTREEARDQVRL